MDCLWGLYGVEGGPALKQVRGGGEGGGRRGEGGFVMGERALLTCYGKMPNCSAPDAHVGSKLKTGPVDSDGAERVEGEWDWGGLGGGGVGQPNQDLLACLLLRTTTSAF